MTARINIFIRAVASVTGDITIGYAMASACIWVIQAAALGLFLSFLLWLLTIIASLAFSQHALHPAVALLLSDRKLDRGLAVGVRCPAHRHRRCSAAVELGSVAANPHDCSRQRAPSALISPSSPRLSSSHRGFFLSVLEVPHVHIP